ncbi:MAG TPA: ABC transporter ATP-binding protein [Planctomycetota bacterium]|nr:ABC transporter ATP-binding protein [Planctomycetota bacterium]
MNFETRGVSKTFGQRSALSDITVTLQQGVPLAILGRSGSGKTTLLRILAGFEPPSAGEVLLDGAFVSIPERVLVPPHKRNVSMVFQDLALWPNLSVFGNVLLGLAGSNLPSKEKRERARQALEMCSIAHLANRHPGRISGGEGQRVALARAVAIRPAFLFLDEPFSGLDAETKAQIVGEIRTLSKSQGLTAVLVTHDPLDAVSLCQQALVLEGGRKVDAGPLATLLRAPESRFLEAFRERLQATFESTGGLR